MQVQLTVKPLGGDQSVELQAEAEPDQAGLYQSRYLPRTNGGYLVEVAVHDETGQLLGRPPVGPPTMPPPNIVPRPQHRPDGGSRERTGGRVIGLENFAIRHEPARSARARHRNPPRPAWHQGPIFLLALLCFVTEWFLRRRKGLP